MLCYDDAAYADSREKLTEAKTKPGRKRIEQRDEEKQFTDKRHIIVAAIDLIVAALDAEVKGTSYISVVLLQLL